MKLYFNPQSRAVVAKWVLDECGAKYDVVPIDLQKGEQKSPGYLRVNPAGKLPALEDGEARVFENVAIALYLADKFPQARLAPAIGEPERGRYLSLMVYATSQLEPAMGDAMLGVEPDRIRGWTSWETVKDVLERELGKGPYLFGDRFTAADIVVGSTLIWARAMGHPPGRPALEAYANHLQKRPHAIRFG
jgi:glutathione S-transferase